MLRNAAAELRVGERSFEFAEQRLGDDEFEGAGEPAANDLCWCAAPRKQGGDEDVRVENGAH